MKLKIVFSMLIFSFLSFANINITDVNLDKKIIANNINYGHVKDIKLAFAKISKIHDEDYVYIRYDVEMQYKYKNTNIIRIMEYNVYHKILDDVTNVNENTYIENSKFYPETEEIKEEITYSKENIDIEDVKYEASDDFENIEVEDELKYLPYIEFDKDGYALIKGTDKRLTAQNNILISYYPEDDESVIEFVDFVDGRFIPKMAAIKKGNIEIASLHEDGVEEIKNLISSKEEYGIKYNEEEIIARILFKDHQITDVEILSEK